MVQYATAIVLLELDLKKSFLKNLKLMSLKQHTILTLNLASFIGDRGGGRLGGGWGLLLRLVHTDFYFESVNTKLNNNFDQFDFQTKDEIASLEDDIESLKQAINAKMAPMKVCNLV